MYKTENKTVIIHWILTDEIDSDDWISSSDESTESEIEEEEESFL
jgi:hypothetical protein